MSLAEMPLITAPGSKVTQIYRWNKDTYQQAISSSGGPEYNVIWTAGDPQLGVEITDLTNDPKAIDENNPVADAPGVDSNSDENNPVAGVSGDATGDDSSSDGGCTCGVPSCFCQ
jgi:hypothetical protein